MHDTLLQSRLRNCLITILELEDSLEQTHLGAALHKEFKILKKVLQRLEEVPVAENDVRRIEAATTHFLSELSECLASVPSEDVMTPWQGARTLH